MTYNKNVDYAPGMRVIIRDEEWVIRKVVTNTLNNRVLYCSGISALVKDRNATFLEDLESIEIVNPANVKLVADDSPHFRKAQLFIESLWRQKIPTDTALHIGQNAAMDLLPYQLEPTQMVLKRPRQRILIADEVGLGKTLEAGILISELIARGKGKRILVVTVKNMMMQFQKELWNRFTIPLVRLDSNRIQKIRANLPSNYNPFFYYDKTIVSIDTLKRDVEYRTHLENAYWDIIVIDEAQNVASRGDKQAQRSKLAELLAGRSDTMIMLSATPHDGKARSFASLMNMLDPTAIANPDDYKAEDIKGLFVRRFKKDIRDEVGGAFLERKVEMQKCKASHVEENVFELFAELSLQMDENRKGGAGQLFKTTLEKSLFSSPAACHKTVENRLKTLYKKYPDGKMKDIASLENLKKALESITTKDFSRYQELLRLLNSSEYAWSPANTEDRLVIFTERIETMKYLVQNLRNDLKLSDKQVIGISGEMSDVEQQEIVENFGRTESPVRILVASDVASEGLNLHHLSHRMIHFDIPWSLMVFQQRNGRIDRYGQKARPDIRYMLIQSENTRIKGDMRIIEILIEKEEQAQKNIGDPSMLMGKFNIEEEELVVSEAIEKSLDAFSFENVLETQEEEFNPFEMFMKEAEGDSVKVEKANDDTLFTDKEYLEHALTFLNKDEKHPFTKMETVSGIKVQLNDEMKRRLSALMPEEAIKDKDTLSLSDDKAFCMKEISRSMQNNLEEAAWPQTQYLWKQHPIMQWVNDKAGLLYNRGEAPVIGLNQDLSKDEAIFIVSGSIPNNKSTPLIDEWFGLYYKGGHFEKLLKMEEVLSKTHLTRELPNTGALEESKIKDLSTLLSDVVSQAKSNLKKFFNDYQKESDVQINEELDKLDSLREKKMVYQRSLFENDERFQSEAERKVNKIFDDFCDYVKDTLTIKDNPYIKVVAVLAGV